MNYLIVFLGAGLGGAGRHGVNVLAARLVGTAFPVGTLAVNALGCFAMGLLAGIFAFRGHLPQEARLFLATGVLGGFTTFSAFSLDAALLWERGNAGLAAFYVLASVLLSLAGVSLGLLLSARLLSTGVP
ncbi:fluoride efflux transporter CrcB [Shinella daejeonensis]|uniref:fluoride efflux transporter CrcB n=1 Tax=Shinella daejeonensis TaxID=659017 RepID=UPI0020C7F87D|nr:fluoride efflux transporter CrcB [Shinella daejeonensis]MCP8897097.1 fluoride efflux transporter CrcB [Shinella daejeonensis]